MPRRLAPLSGLAGIVLVVAGLGSDRAPTSSWADARIVHWYATHGVGQWLLSAYVLALGAPFLLVFTAVVRDRMAELGVADRPRSLVLGAGTAYAVLVIVGAGLYVAVPAAMTFSHAPAPSPDVSRYLLGAGYGVLVMFSALVAAVFAFVVSVVSLRSGLLPRWLAIGGIPASVLMLANAVMPMAVITLWFVAASVALAVRARPSAAPVAAHAALAA